MMSMLLANVWGLLTVDSTNVFKSLFVADALDGSEDHLVSEKLFRLIGTDMLSFRAELLMQQHRKSLEGVVKQLIAPKRIKRKEFEGTEFFIDFTDPEEADVSE